MTTRFGATWKLVLRDLTDKASLREVTFAQTSGPAEAALAVSLTDTFIGETSPFRLYESGVPYDWER